MEMKKAHKVTEKIGWLMNAEIEMHEEKCLVKKKRTFTVFLRSNAIAFTLDLDIWFTYYEESGLAFNKAEIFLLPEEVPVFTLTLREYAIPFPTVYRQRQIVNPHVIAVHMESLEPPDHFFQRLAAAFYAVKQKKENRAAIKRNFTTLQKTDDSLPYWKRNG